MTVLSFMRYMCLIAAWFGNTDLGPLQRQFESNKRRLIIWIAVQEWWLCARCFIFFYLIKIWVHYIIFSVLRAMACHESVGRLDRFYEYHSATLLWAILSPLYSKEEKRTREQFYTFVLVNLMPKQVGS